MREENKIAILEQEIAIPDRLRRDLPVSGVIVEAETAQYLRTYWRVIQKRRWTLFSMVLVIFTLALIGTLKETPIYRARALVEIQKENPNILSLQELFQLESVSDTYLESQYKILQAETLAKRVMQQLNLENVAEFNPPARWWRRSKHNEAADKETGEIANSDKEQAILRQFASHLVIEPVRQSRLVQVSFESQDRVLAANVVNALTSNYIEENLENRWQATQKATEWISQQLQGLKIRLEKSEDELQQYAQANGLLFLESGGGKSENIMDERLRQIQEELTKVQAERFQKEAIYRLIQAGDYSSLPGVMDNKLIQDLTARLSELQTAYAQLATTFSAEYPKVKQLQNQIDETQSIVDRERKHVVDRLTNEYVASVHREGLVEKAFQEQEKQANEMTARSVQYNILKREVDTNKQLYEGLLQRMKEASVSAGLKASNIRIVDAAVPPASPVKPRVPLNLALALLLGLTGGIGMAFLQEHLDNTLKNSEDVERFVQLPALATIPALESLNGHRRVYGLSNFKKTAEVPHNGSGPKPAERFRIDETAPQYSSIGEAFRGLRTSVLLSTANRPPRTLLVTSAQPAEGKTTVSTNLAISCAQLGQRVLLIDADLRRPTIHRVFKIPSSPGLVNYLAGLSDWSDVVSASSVAGLDIMPSGPISPNPVELLSSERMRKLLREAEKKYTMVVVDSPPVLNVADSRVLAVEVEGVVLVVRGNVTPHDVARRARACVQNVGGNVIGVVLNNVDVRNGDYHYYYYRDYYGSRSEGSAEGENKS
jgi:capsular exopolysaccharide synthesis family protein